MDVRGQNSARKFVYLKNYVSTNFRRKNLCHHIWFVQQFRHKNIRTYCIRYVLNKDTINYRLKLTAAAMT